jgi:8-oxo-dGTP pyrophosphatase MutT (NUDIX family)
MNDVTRRRPGGKQTLPRPARWSEVTEPLWERVDHAVLRDFPHITAAVRDHRPDPRMQVPPPEANPSAVLVTLVDDVRGPSVLLTRRAEWLSTHKGQIAFPGGRLEPGESSLTAALREAREEIGLESHVVTPIGELVAHRTVSSASHIIPHVVVAQALPSEYVTSSEVDRVFTVPLVELVRPDTFVEEYWVFPDREVRVPFFYLDDETIWGATARMLHALIGVVTARQ